MVLTTERVRAAIESTEYEPLLDKLEQSVRKARRAMLDGEQNVEELIADTSRQVRRHPVMAMTIAGGAGMLVGCAVGFMIGWKSRA